MRLARMTTRRWMLSVLVVALAFGVVRMLVLRQRYLDKAAMHASFRAFVLWTPDSVAYWERRWTDQRQGLPASYPWPDRPPFVPAMMKYHDSMRVKYEYAASHPWLPIEPDPL